MTELPETPRGAKQRMGLVAFPLLALALLLFVELDPERPEVTRMAAVAILMAGWWITEAIPIPATAMLPVVLFPVFGIQSGADTAALYFNNLIFLFIGGFLFALAMQRWDLHRRIALGILSAVGSGPRRAIFGFMFTSWFLSMWISNTATTMMMVPMAMAVTAQLRERFGAERPDETTKLGTGILLGTAYAASIGGVATLIGTPPNLSFARILEILFPAAPTISFATWFGFALPLAVVFLVVAWLLLCRMYAPRRRSLPIDTAMFARERRRLGPLTMEQGAVLALFFVLVFGWMFRRDIEAFGVAIPGWSRLMPVPGDIDDGTVAMTVALVLFLIPSRNRPGEMLMNWETATGLKWGIVLLFGGGFALASGFKHSGLSTHLGEQLAGLEGTPPVLLVLLTCGLLTFLTELTSNLATTEMVLPVLGSMAVTIETNPLLLMVPATLSASCAFMLPVATPPNAIAFGSGEVKMSDMIRTGLLLNLIGMLLITAAVYLLGMAALGIEPGVFPEWARTH